MIFFTQVLLLAVILGAIQITVWIFKDASKRKDMM